MDKEKKNYYQFINKLHYQYICIIYIYKINKRIFYEKLKF